MAENKQKSKTSIFRKGLLFLILLLSPYLLVVGVEEIAYNVFLKNQTSISYTQKNSSLLGRIQVVETDDDGYVWIGTENGLNSVSPDGLWTSYTSENSGLPNNNIQSLAIDRLDNIWIGTDKGLYVLDSNNEWETYLSINDQHYQPRVGVLALLVDNSGKTWIGTSQGLYIYDSNNITPLTAKPFGVPLETITALATDRFNRVWVGTKYGLRMVDSNGVWKIYNQNPMERDSSLRSDDTTAVLVDTQDRVWVGTTWGTSILNPDGTWAQFFHNHPNKTLYSYDSEPAYSFALDKQGRVWTAQSRILTVQDKSGMSYSFALHESDIEYVRDLAVDQHERLWLGTVYDGLKVVDLSKGVPKPIPNDWILWRSKLILPIRITVGVIEPFLGWMFLPVIFGTGGSVVYFACLAGIVLGIIGMRRGARDSNRSMLDFSRGMLMLSVLGAILLWTLACLLVFLFMRD